MGHGAKVLTHPYPHKRGMSAPLAEILIGPEPNLHWRALAASQEQQRRLVADAGHELRTPLTSMRTNLELLAAASRPGAPSLPEGCKPV